MAFVSMSLKFDSFEKLPTADMRNCTPILTQQPFSAVCVSRDLGHSVLLSPCADDESVSILAHVATFSSFFRGYEHKLNVSHCISASREDSAGVISVPAQRPTGSPYNVSFPPLLLRCGLGSSAYPLPSQHARSTPLSLAPCASITSRVRTEYGTKGSRRLRSICVGLDISLHTSFVHAVHRDAHCSEQPHLQWCGIGEASEGFSSCTFRALHAKLACRCIHMVCQSSMNVTVFTPNFVSPLHCSITDEHRTSPHRGSHLGAGLHWITLETMYTMCHPPLRLVINSVGLLFYLGKQLL